MTWFGRPFQPFELKQGNFLSSEHRKLITEEATIIFINNYAFQSDLESRIKRELLSDLKDGTRIISTKPYVPLNKQVTDRQMKGLLFWGKLNFWVLRHFGNHGGDRDAAMPEPVLMDVRLCALLPAHHQPGKGGGIVFYLIF